jgi:two-component system, cell cycle sensor histidine kinase and response regulator CckA
MQVSKLNNNFSGALKYRSKSERDYLPENSKTILVIDDEELLIKICEMMLKRLGHYVFKAYSGSDGIKIFEANKNKIDLIISDMNMPEMNGQEVIDRLRKIDRNVKVLLSSGALLDSDEKEVIKRGFNGFIKKPFKLNTLSKKMTEIIN